MSAISWGPKSRLLSGQSESHADLVGTALVAGGEARSDKLKKRMEHEEVPTAPCL